MEEKRNFYKAVEDICGKDSRYKPDAYEFVLQALYFTQKKLKKETHLTGKELLEGIRELIIEKYGVMSKTVLKHWGIFKTEDFGNIVFNMVDNRIFSKTEKDSIDDFKDVYDFDSVFGKNILRDNIIKGN
ncbi:MAG: hypothetical protein PHN57_01100 [Candidatus Omnitrophica bacterium]|nr:hypothetical protein [Candidatus Omnitrophota bacterium]